jgi:hypothetical protein
MSPLDLLWRAIDRNECSRKCNRWCVSRIGRQKSYRSRGTRFSAGEGGGSIDEVIGDIMRFVAVELHELDKEWCFGASETGPSEAAWAAKFLIGQLGRSLATDMNVRWGLFGNKKELCA